MPDHQHVGWVRSNGAGQIVFRQAAHPGNEVDLSKEGWKRVYLDEGTEKVEDCATCHGTGQITNSISGLMTWGSLCFACGHTGKMVVTYCDCCGQQTARRSATEQEAAA